MLKKILITGCSSGFRTLMHFLRDDQQQCRGEHHGEQCNHPHVQGTQSWSRLERRSPVSSPPSCWRPPQSAAELDQAFTIYGQTSLAF